MSPGEALCVGLAGALVWGLLVLKAATFAASALLPILP